MTAEVTRSAVKSALRPGVELGVDDGSVSMVARLSDIARGEVAGYNASIMGSYRQLFPRLSRRDYEKLSYTDLPDSPVQLREILQTIPGLRPKDILDFSLARRLARQTLQDGTYRDVVVPNIKDLATEMDLADYDELEGFELDVIPDLAQRVKTRTYTLTQVMSDLDVKQKYQLPTRVYITGERLAATDAPAAAQVFQDAMNAVQDHTRVRVVPGMLSIDSVQAANTIAMMAYGTPQVNYPVRSEIVVDKIFMYPPEDSEIQWHVLGPIKRAADVMAVYRIVCAQGPILPSGLLAVDLVQLKIDIFNGQDYMEPTMQYNVAERGEFFASVGLSEAAAREMTAGQRAVLATMTDRLLPVLDKAGRQLATAVRVTDKHVLFNDHVHAADAAAAVGGRRLSLSCRVARDVWASEVSGQALPWVYRQPSVGEFAVILYITEGVVSCTAPVIVESVGSDVVMTSGSIDVVRGVSGGALVALSDFSLFGIHSASVGGSLLNYRFGPEQLEEVVGSDTSTSVSRVADTESFAAVLVKRFSDKGLGSTFRSTCSSVMPLWHQGVHMGMALVDNGRAYTTFRRGSDGVPESFANHDGTQKFEFDKTEASLPYSNCLWSSTKIPLRRLPRLGEKVFIIGFDDELYVTNPTEVAHIFAMGKGFVLNSIAGLDKPVAGGAVVALDGAVVGLAGAEFSFDTPVGYGLRCSLMAPILEAATSNVRAVLAEAFPYLRLDKWPDDVLEEVFTHASAGHYSGPQVFNVGNRPLGVLGDAYLRFLNGKVLREHGIPHAEWSSHMQALQSNAAMALIPHRFGLHKCMIMGKGVQLPYGSRSFADLVEALMGAAALLEEERAVLRLASDMGLIFDAEQEESVVNVSEAAVD